MAGRQPIAHANRGADLEQLLIATCRTYRAQGRAVITRVPDPIKVIKGGYKHTRNGKAWVITEAVPDSGADKTVDFFGIWNGIGIAFDAKESRDPNRFPLDNIKPHQMEYMRDFVQQNGIAFILLRHIPAPNDDTVYLLPFQMLWQYWEAAGRADPFGRKARGAQQSIPIDEIRMWPEVKPGRGVYLDFLSAWDQAECLLLERNLLQTPMRTGA